jgi:hypothetical protein
MGKYSIYQGIFACHVCKAEVKTLRSYPDEKLLTWMCKDKHLSQVNLDTKRKRADIEREERE